MPAKSLLLPKWTGPLLIAAAIYNIAWGVFIVFFPLLPFRWASMPAPSYPALVQCFGMIVGVFGVAYYLAAKDPLNRWPLILVGLVGKVLGPIGFVFAATWCEFPWRAGWTIVTNDLIWWIPFASILIHVVRIRDEQRTIAESLNLEQVLRETIATTGESLLDISHKQDMLIVCLRHSGCTFCREALSDLSLQKPAIEKANVRPIVVHMGNVSDGDQLARQYCLEDVLFISDPTRRIYRALDLKLGTLSQLIGPRTFWRALIGGPVFRHGFGAFKGNGFQMPGTFLIRNGHVINAFRNESPADRPNYTTLATCEISQTPT